MTREAELSAIWKTTDLIIFQEKAPRIGKHTERLGMKIGKDRPFLPLEALGPAADSGRVFPKCFRVEEFPTRKFSSQH